MLWCGSGLPGGCPLTWHTQQILFFLLSSNFSLSTYLHLSNKLSRKSNSVKTLQRNTQLQPQAYHYYNRRADQPTVWHVVAQHPTTITSLPPLQQPRRPTTRLLPLFLPPTDNRWYCMAEGVAGPTAEQQNGCSILIRINTSRHTRFKIRKDWYYTVPGLVWWIVL